MVSIEINSLKKYYGNIKAVDGISFTVNQGEVFGLLGPNGAGKTTTIEIMEGLRERDGGEIRPPIPRTTRPLSLPDGPCGSVCAPAL